MFLARSASVHQYVGIPTLIHDHLFLILGLLLQDNEAALFVTLLFANV